MLRLKAHHLLLAGTASGLALAMFQPAFAQQAAETELSPIVVEGGQTGGAEDKSGVGKVKGVVAKTSRTGSKTATEIKDIPQSVSVVGREEMDDQGVQKADEALRYVPGVFTQPFGSDSDTNWMFIRGFQATADGAYMDGLQLYSYAFGGFYIDSFGLERVEVLKGPASVLYGGANPGGIVNYVSKRPTFERKRYVETGVNDAGNAYLGFDIGDVADDTVSYRINGRVAGGHGYSDFQSGWRGFISPSITWKADEQTSLTLLANYSHIDERHGGGSFLPYEGTVVDRVVGGVNYGRIPTDFNATEKAIDAYDRKQGSIGYEFEHTFDSQWTVRSNARYMAADINEVNVYPNGWASANELSRINFAHDTKAKSFLIDNQIEGTVNTGAFEHTLLGGLDYRSYNIDQKQYNNLFDPAANPIDPWHPVYGGPLAARILGVNQEYTAQQFGLYAQDQIRFGDGWLVTLNGRYDWSWLDRDSRQDYYTATWGSPVVDLSRSDGNWSGRAGVAYEFANGLTPYASVATFFNPTIGTDVYTGELFKPEEGVQYEVGLKYEPSFIDGLFTVALFDLTRQNVASYVTAYDQTQTGEIRSRGIEVEAKVNVTEDFKVTAAFTAMDVDITKDDLRDGQDWTGHTPFITPEIMASISADYTFRGDSWYDGLTIGGGVRHIGSSWGNNENTLKVPAVTLVDAKIGYKKGNWGVDLNVTNLFDKSYVSACQINIYGQACSYGEGRSFKLKAYTSW
ncbi:TonB-dependent siderophore receptor [Shinella zoogloeoides]|uniref:TonB-dependent siderophore receptor n=1 Tax=Shinella zoogloeoides TaxID=352475 RepID=UPI0028AD09DF|nr:TonB-dependent siderophore receptor [Shinella zoogloeoides]